jgi:hypothetical protein
MKLCVQTMCNYFTDSLKAIVQLFYYFTDSLNRTLCILLFLCYFTVKQSCNPRRPGRTLF